MGSFMNKHSHASNLLKYNAVTDEASALLKKDKLSSSERSLKDKKINISDSKEKENFKAYKASGGKLSHTQAATIGYRTPQQSKAVIAEKKSIKDAKSKATRVKAEQSGLGEKFFAGANPNIYKKK
jgi:hypothetical protein